MDVMKYEITKRRKLPCKLHREKYRRGKDERCQNADDSLFDEFSKVVSPWRIASITSFSIKQCSFQSQ